MRLTVLGATGGIGRHLVSHALADGHQVTAAVRNPDGVTARHANLTVVRANVLDAGALKPTLEGADAVLSAMGPARRSDPLHPASSATLAAIDAMNATGVRRILVVSAAPLNRTGAGESFLVRRFFGPLLWAVLADNYADLAKMEQALRDSGLDWTSVRPPRLTNGAERGAYRHAVEAGPGGSGVSRADLARAMIDFLNRPETVGHAVGVSN